MPILEPIETKILPNFLPELHKLLKENPFLSQKDAANKLGLYMLPRRRKDGVIAELGMVMTTEKMLEAGGTFMWHPFHNALLKDGWVETDSNITGIFAGGTSTYSRTVGEFEFSKVRWSIVVPHEPLAVTSHYVHWQASLPIDKYRALKALVLQPMFVV